MKVDGSGSEPKMLTTTAPAGQGTKYYTTLIGMTHSYTNTYTCCVSLLVRNLTDKIHLPNSGLNQITPEL